MMVCSATAAVGCSLLVGVDGLSGGPGSESAAGDATPPGDASPLDASSDASSDGPDASAACPTGRGPAMVVAAGFCIDSTEVTNGQFRDFLLSGPTVAMLPPECAWKTSYASGTGAADLPVGNVDWCDAVAFCAWAGKRLCGKIGGGSNDFADYALFTKSQWFSACSHAGDRVYAYGSTFDGKACNDRAYDAGAAIPVKSAPRCEGGYPGLFDMTGNVWEWEDSCIRDPDGGPSLGGDRCRARGGTWLDDNTEVRCDFDHLEHFDPRRSTARDYLGFRCCAN